MELTSLIRQLTNYHEVRQLTDYHFDSRLLNHAHFK